MNTAASLILLVTFSLRAAEAPALKLTKTIPLPGVKGRFDHFAIDPERQRLFVAALGNNTLEVVDIKAGQRLRSIAGLHKPTGVLFLAKLNQIAVANGDDGILKLFDATSSALLKSVGSLDDGDNVRFDAQSKLIYVGYAAGALALIDATTMKQTGSIKLAAHPESFQLERQGRRIFVNVPEAKRVAVIDRDKKSVTATWPMTEFKANFPMALDEVNHRLFIGCRQPARLVVLDTGNGKLVTDLEISGDTDDLFYDAARRRIYVSCGEGFVDVVQVGEADHYARVERVPTRVGARTCFFSPDLDRLFVAAPPRQGRDAEIRVYAPSDNR